LLFIYVLFFFKENWKGLHPYNIFIEKKIKIQNKIKLRAREEGELRQEKRNEKKQSYHRKEPG